MGCGKRRGWSTLSSGGKAVRSSRTGKPIRYPTEDKTSLPIGLTLAERKSVTPVLNASGKGWKKFSRHEWEKKIGNDYEVIYDWRPNLHFEVLRWGKPIAVIPLSPKGAEAMARERALRRVKNVIATDRVLRRRFSRLPIIVTTKER